MIYTLTLTLTTCNTKTSSAITTPISFKTARITAQTVHIASPAAPCTTTPESEAISPPLSHHQRTPTSAMTSNGTAPLLGTTLRGDRPLILKSVILVYGRHTGLPTRCITHTPEDPHVPLSLDSSAQSQG